MIGQSLREAVKSTLEMSGSTVRIEGAVGPEALVKALKNREDGRDYFAFLDVGCLKEGAVILIAEGNEKWIVNEIERIVRSDVLVKVKAYVQRTGAVTPFSGPASGPLTINAHGGQVIVQHGGQGNVQHVSIANHSELERNFEDLRQIIAGSSLGSLDKEEALAEMERVRTLAKRPPTPELLERINGRLGTLSGIVASASSIAVQIAPLIDGIRRCVGA